MPIEVFGTVQFGYEVVTRGWDWYKTRGTPFRTDAFIEEHSECVKAAIDLVTDVESLADDELEKAIGEILRMIANIARALRPKDEVNASYMVPLPPTPELIQQARFTDRRLPPAAFECFLVLKGWAKDIPTFPRD